MVQVAVPWVDVNLLVLYEACSCLSTVTSSSTLCFSFSNQGLIDDDLHNGCQKMIEDAYAYRLNRSMKADKLEEA
jgi:hypothetical protein